MLVQIMKGKSNVCIEFSSESDALAALTALKQEEEFKKRSNSKVSVNGRCILIEITADDLVALRATLNSYLRLLQTIESININNINEE